MNKTVFLDRDGLINRQAPPHEYISERKDFEILPKVPEAIKALNEAGYLIILVTNQRGISRGMLTMEKLNDIHKFMCEEIEKYGAHIDDIYICPHDNGQCRCRKPDIGLFLQAEKNFKIDKSASWMVGDSETDVEAGRRYGVKTILTKDLYEAVQTILREDKQ